MGPTRDPVSVGMWRRVARDVSILVSSALIMVLLQTTFRLQAIHELSAANYGRIALLIGIFFAATVIGQYGTPDAAARLGARTLGKRRDRELLASLAKAALLPTLVASLVVGCATLWVTHSAFIAAMGFAGTPPLVASGVCSGFVRGKGLIWQAAFVLPANLVAQIAALAVVVAAGVNVGVGWVLACFTIGNVAAFAAGASFVRGALRHAPTTEDDPDPEASPRQIMSYSVWLSLSTLCVLGLGLIPRIALAHVSYQEVAYFDVALLIYTIPQRLRSSFVMAIIPLAAVEQRRKSLILVPGRLDLGLVTAGVLVVDGVLWLTHALSHALDIAGLHQYTGAEPLLLIILLGTPAELFFSLNSGLLQAFGDSKRLAARGALVLTASAIAAPLTTVLGAKYLAALLAMGFWALYILTRRLLTSHNIGEQSMLGPLFVRRLRLGWAD